MGNKSKLKIANTITWDYRMKLFKDTCVPKTLIKVFFFLTVAIMLFMLILAAIEGDFSANLVVELGGVFGLVFIGLVVLTLISYYIVFAAIHGGKYDIVYQMDDKGVSFITAKGTMDKVEKTALVGALAGASAGNLTVLGSNMISGYRSSMYTKFVFVTRVEIIIRKKKVLLTESHVAKNHIYTNDDNFEDVRKHILESCKKAKIIIRR